MDGNHISVNPEEVNKVGNQLEATAQQMEGYLERLDTTCRDLFNYVHGSLSGDVLTVNNKVNILGKKICNYVTGPGGAIEFLKSRMGEYGVAEETAYQALEGNINRLGEIASTISSSFTVSLSSTVAPWIGQRMNNGANGCVEAVTKMGASNNAFLKQELDNGVVNVGTLVRDAEASGVKVVDFYPNSLNTGDIIVYDEGSHVVMYSGQGTGYYGNSTSQMQIVQGDNYNYMGGMVPTQIIKTSGGWTP